jgi:hypothetical protein
MNAINRKTRSRFAWSLLAVIACLTALLAPALLLAAPVGGVLVAATTATTDMQSAMKVIFADPLVNNVVTDTELLSLFEQEMNVKSDETTGGRYVEMAHLFRLPAGVGARAEGDYLPVPDNPVFVNSRVYLKKVQGTIEMSGDTMRRIKDDEGAWLNYLEQSLPLFSKRVSSEIDRMLIGYGAGIKARIATGGIAGSDITIDRALGVTGWQDPFLQFLEGERIVASANANGSPLRNAGTGQSAQITNINDTTNVLTVDAVPAAWAADDYLFSGDSSGASVQSAGVDREIAGLLAAVDDGTILATYNNIARSSYRLWQSIVIDGSASPYDGVMTEELLTFADDETFVKGGSQVDIIVASRSAARGYWKSLKSDRFFVDPRAYAGGKAGLSIVLGDRTLMLKVARKLPPQLAFGLTKSSFRRLTLGTWTWDDTTGAIWNRVTDSTGRKDAFYGTGYMYEQLFCTRPRENFRIQGLTRVS